MATGGLGPPPHFTEGALPIPGGQDWRHALCFQRFITPRKPGARAEEPGWELERPLNVKAGTGTQSGRLLAFPRDAARGVPSFLAYPGAQSLADRPK
jgi:hypothetical protein